MVKPLEVDIDPNEGDTCVIYQIFDDRFYLVVRVERLRLGETLGAISALHSNDEVVFGTISCGERVWVVRDEAGYWLAIGDSDSKDLSYRIAEAEVGQLLSAETI